MTQSSVEARGKERTTGDVLDARVVFLVNFLAPNHVPVCRELARRLSSFTVLCSVAMEGNRDWKPDWQGLDVDVQKTWTITRNVDHPGGYRDVNYIHIPRDTFSQLRRLRPDAIVSLELGARTLLAGAYRKWASRCAMVTSVCASERSEAGRGWIRKATRRKLLRDADWVTFNGPSCRKYLLGLGADENRMSPWDYAADPTKPYRGPLQPGLDNQVMGIDRPIRILTVGQLSERKGVLPAARQLSAWAKRNPELSLEWHLLGSGPLEDDLREFDWASNLSPQFHGHCDPDQIRSAYRESDVLLFPTLTDEWGLVVDEAMHSGLPVIGSIHSQAATTLISAGENGVLYDPECEDPATSESLAVAMNGWYWGETEPAANAARRPRSREEHFEARQAARHHVRTRTPETSASQLIQAIESAMHRRFNKPLD
ncbi:MAG: glycosyltransferase family 4 protein [Planctomycetota bacterium]